MKACRATRVRSFFLHQPDHSAHVPAPFCRRGAIEVAAEAVGTHLRPRHRWSIACIASLGWLAFSSAYAAEPALVPYTVSNGRIEAPLTAEAGDPARGKAAVLSRDGGNCFLCHSVPDPGDTPLGNIGPPLAGVGNRLSAGELRLRMVDSTRINPASVMPAYYRVEGLQRVAASYAGRPLLSAQLIEDVIAYLLTLK